MKSIADWLREVVSGDQIGREVLGIDMEMGPGGLRLLGMQGPMAGDMREQIEQLVARFNDEVAPEILIRGPVARWNRPGGAISEVTLDVAWQSGTYVVAMTHAGGKKLAVIGSPGEEFDLFSAWRMAQLLAILQVSEETVKAVGCALGIVEEEGLWVKLVRRQAGDRFTEIVEGQLPGEVTQLVRDLYQQGKLALGAIHDEMIAGRLTLNEVERSQIPSVEDRDLAIRAIQATMVSYTDMWPHLLPHEAGGVLERYVGDSEDPEAEVAKVVGEIHDELVEKAIQAYDLGRLPAPSQNPHYLFDVVMAAHAQRFEEVCSHYQDSIEARAAAWAVEQSGKEDLTARYLIDRYHARHGEEAAE